MSQENFDCNENVIGEEQALNSMLDAYKTFKENGFKDRETTVDAIWDSLPVKLKDDPNFKTKLLESARSNGLLN